MNKLVATMIAGAGALAANSAVAAPILGGVVKVQATGDVTATFSGNSSTFISVLGLNGGPSTIFTANGSGASSVGDTYDLGNYSAGTILTFYINVMTTGYKYFTGPGSLNPDKIPHALVNTVGNVTTVGFEDIYGGGDKDYNDLVFSFTNTAGGVPEPATWAMMMVGAGLIGAALRRRRAHNVSVSYA